MLDRLPLIGYERYWLVVQLGFNYLKFNFSCYGYIVYSLFSYGNDSLVPIVMATVIMVNVGNISVTHIWQY